MKAPGNIRVFLLLTFSLAISSGTARARRLGGRRLFLIDGQITEIQV